MPALCALRPGVDCSPFGSQIVWAQDPNLSTYAGHLQSAGVQWARSELIWWGLCEQTTGVLKFNVGNWSCDNWLNQLKTRGIKPYCILCYGNPLYGGTPNTPEGRAAFSNFCSQIVTKYKDQADVWEIWNEPNSADYWGAPPSASDYAALVAAAAPAIRAADPDCIIVGGVTAGIDQTFLTSCFNAGMLQHVNAVSVHPYRIDRPESINSEISALRTKMNTYANGSNVKIWSGEWGYNAGWSEIDETDQARMLSRMMVNNLSQGIELSIWFSVHSWAVTEDWGLTDLSLQPRAAHKAMGVINQRLAAPIKHITSPYGLRFTPTNTLFREETFEHASSDQRTVAVWLADGLPPTTSTLATDIRLTLQQQFRLSAYDGLSGNRLALDTNWNLSGGTVTMKSVPITSYPIFVDVEREVLPAGARLTTADFQRESADSEFAGQPVSLAFDAVVTAASKWTTLSTPPPHWLAVELKQGRHITGFALRLPSLAGEYTIFNARAVEFQTAPTPTGPWTSVAVASNPLQEDRIISILSTPVDAQYIRLLVTDTGVDNYARIQEFEIYATSLSDVGSWALY